MTPSLCATRVIELPGLTVTVRELSVSDVRAWLLELESGAAADPFFGMLFEGFSLADLPHMSDVTIERVGAFTPSELAPLITAAKALNPDFYRTDARHGGKRCTSDDVDRSCCALVSHGHAGVWHYPWKTYLTALRAVSDNQHR